MHLVLSRILYDPLVTLGRLRVGSLQLATLEEPWIPDPDGPGGQRRQPGKHESCVPDGEYTLYPHTGQVFKDVWVLENQALGVYRFDFDIPFGQQWGRSSILIHSGNTTDDILGCILVGLTHGKLGDKDAVLNSRVALTRLREVLKQDKHILEIKPAQGPGTGNA